MNRTQIWSVIFILLSTLTACQRQSPAPAKSSHVEEAGVNKLDLAQFKVSDDWNKPDSSGLTWTQRRARASFDKAKTHLVKADETLRTIIEKYYPYQYIPSAMCADDFLCKVNSLRYDEIKPGVSLKIPATKDLEKYCQERMSRNPQTCSIDITAPKPKKSKASSTPGLRP